MVKIQQNNENVQSHVTNLNSNCSSFAQKSVNTNSFNFTQMSGTQSLTGKINQINSMFQAFESSLNDDIQLLSDYASTVVERDNQAAKTIDEKKQ